MNDLTFRSINRLFAFFSFKIDDDGPTRVSFDKYYTTTYMIF